MVSEKEKKSEAWVWLGPGTAGWLKQEIAYAEVPPKEFKEIVAEAALRRKARQPRVVRVAVTAAQLLMLALLPLVVVVIMLALTRITWLSMAVAVMATLVALVLTKAAFPRTIARDLRDVLRERGYEVCVKCGYSLQALGEEIARCPECGAEREPMPGAKP